MSSAAGKGSFYSEKVDKDEEKEFETGPLSILMHSVKQNTQVIFTPISFLPLIVTLGSYQL
jgi:hypothetical protein